MRIDLRDLDVQRFDLDVPVPDGEPITLLFEKLTDGRGLIEVGDDTTALEGLAIRELLLSILSLPLAPGAQLRTSTPATITSATMDGRIAHGLIGTLRFGLIETTALELLAGDIRAQSDFRTEEVKLTLEKDGGRAALGSVVFAGAQTNAGGFLTRLGSLAVTGLKIGWKQQAVRIEALKAHAHAITTSRENVSLSVAGVDLADGLVIDGRELRVPQLLIGQADLVVDDLLGEARRAAAEAAREADEPPAAPAADPLRFDPGILDTVNGQLDVDLTLSATVPVLGRRTATHHFRIPIDGGIIDYREVERDLADLEDAFIDITPRGNQLVLERRIPLIPGFDKPIVTWDLGEGEVELAKQHLVRLRTLIGAQLPPGEAAAAKKSKLKLHKIDFDDVAIRLSIDDAPVLSSGDGSLRTSLDELEVTGNLHVQPEAEHAPAALSLTAHGLTAVARDLELGGVTLASGELRVGAIESATLTFDGLKPQRLEIRLRNLSLSDLVLRV